MLSNHRVFVFYVCSSPLVQQAGNLNIPSCMVTKSSCLRMTGVGDISSQTGSIFKTSETSETKHMFVVS